MKNYEINFIKNFNNEEKEKIEIFVDNNFNELELHPGYNNSVDVSDAIGRTAWVDIEVYEA